MAISWQVALSAVIMLILEFRTEKKVDEREQQGIIPHGIVVKCLFGLEVEVKPTHLTFGLSTMGQIAIILGSTACKLYDWISVCLICKLTKEVA